MVLVIDDMRVVFNVDYNIDNCDHNDDHFMILYLLWIHLITINNLFYKIRDNYIKPCKYSLETIVEIKQNLEKQL